jgi:hypothetical protein
VTFQISLSLVLFVGLDCGVVLASHAQLPGREMVS